jgi:hypothetical protein
VDAEQFRRRLHAHLFGDERTPKKRGNELGRQCHFCLAMILSLILS